MFRILRQAMKTAAYNFVNWKKSPRIYLCFVLTFVMCSLLTDKAMQFALEHESTLQFMEPFIWTFGDSESILLSSVLLLLLLSDMPYLGKGTPYFLMRTDRKTWILGQVIYTVLSVTIHMAAIFISCGLLCMRNAFSGNKWSRTAAILGFSGDGQRIALPSLLKTLMNDRPYKCALLVFLLMLSYSLTLALIMLFFTIWKGSMGGVLSAVIFTAYGYLMDPEKLAKIFKLPDYLKYKARVFCGWISPLNQATYHMHDFGYDELPRMWQTFAIFGVMTVILIMMSVLAIRHYDFNFRGKDE